MSVAEDVASGQQWVAANVPIAMDVVVHSRLVWTCSSMPLERVEWLRQIDPSFVHLVSSWAVVFLGPPMAGALEVLAGYHSNSISEWNSLLELGAAVVMIVVPLNHHSLDYHSKVFVLVEFVLQI